MMTILTPTESERYLRARKKAREIRSFYISLCCYCIVMPVLIWINLTYTPQFYWFFFSMIGWGFGLAFHAMSAFGWYPFLGPKWEERKLREILDKEREKTGRESSGNEH